MPWVAVRLGSVVAVLSRSAPNVAGQFIGIGIVFETVLRQNRCLTDVYIR